MEGWGKMLKSICEWRKTTNEEQQQIEDQKWNEDTKNEMKIQK